MTTSPLRGRAAGSDVATRTTDGPAPTVYQLIERQKDEIARALPKHLDADRLARIVVTTIRQNPDLMQCEPASLLGAIMTCSQLGLEPGPLGEAYLVPFGRDVTFIAGYRGLIKLAWNSGMLQSIQAHVVYDCDEFDYAYGLQPRLEHKPSLTRPDDATRVAVYAAAVLKDGGTAFVVMSPGDVQAIKGRSRSASSGRSPWTTDTDAMWRKTAVRQLAKWLPMSASLAGFQHAAEADATVRNDFTAPLEESVLRHDDGPAPLQGTVVEQAEATHEEARAALVDPDTGEVLS